MLEKGKTTDDLQMLLLLSVHGLWVQRSSVKVLNAHATDVQNSWTPAHATEQCRAHTSLPVVGRVPGQ